MNFLPHIGLLEFPWWDPTRELPDSTELIVDEPAH